MSSSSITQAPNAPRVLRPTVLMVALHSILWAAVLFGLFVVAPNAEQVFRDFNLKLSPLTQLMMFLSRWVENHAPFVGAFVFFFLIVDGMGYYRLRSSAPRFISKLWAVSMFLLPVLVIMGLTIGILRPLLAFQEGLSK